MAAELEPTPATPQPATSQQDTPVAQYLFQGLVSRGFNAAQAAALVGNMKQESEWNPTAPNPGEGAVGLIQWRDSPDGGHRRTDLLNFAQQTGRSAYSLDTQMDFIVHEMRTTEVATSAAFRAANDVAGANAALRHYIRYGDDSEPTRLQYAQRISKGDFSSAPVSRMNHGGASGGQFASLDGGEGYGYSLDPIHLQRIQHQPTFLESVVDNAAPAAAAPAAGGGAPAALAAKPTVMPSPPQIALPTPQQVAPMQPPAPIAPAQTPTPMQRYLAMLNPHAQQDQANG